MNLIALYTNPIDVAKASQLIRNSKNGGECHFTGTVRDYHGDRIVTHLEFEAYEPMAVKELTKIAETTKDKFNISEVLIHHRLGIVEPGGIAVLIIVTAPHRTDVFNACSYVIDTLKQTVPIWKKEVYKDGDHWVSAHP